MPCVFYPVYAVAARDLNPSRDRPVGLSASAREALTLLTQTLGASAGPYDVELRTTVFCEFWAGHIPAVIAECNGMPQGSWGERMDGVRRFIDVTGWFLYRPREPGTVAA
jgi:hypothetical protein